MRSPPDRLLPPEFLCYSNYMSRSRRSFRRGLGLVLVVVHSSFGCGTRGPEPPSAAELAGRDARVVVVAPLNVASSLPVEIEGSAEIVATTLVQYLEEHGKKAQKLNFRGGRELWVVATQQVAETRQKRNFENAASAYAREIRKQVEYDVLIIPTLYLQNVRVRGRVAKWDGAREPIRIEGSRNLSKMNHTFDRMNADIRAASIMATVIAADGSAIQSENRGLQMIEHVQLHGRKVFANNPSFTIEANSPPLDDAVKIRAGIAGALAPFLPELPAVVEASATGAAKPE